MNPLVLKAGNDLIPFRDVKRINIAHLERAQVAIETYVGETYYAFGFDAIEALMAIKPSAMEDLKRPQLGSMTGLRQLHRVSKKQVTNEHAFDIWIGLSPNIVGLLCS